MAVKMIDRIEVIIEEGKEKHTFPLWVKLELSAKDKAAFERFKKAQEKKYAEIEEASKKAQRLARRIERLREDLDDIAEELRDAEGEERAELREERKALRRELRAAEDELETLKETYDLARYQEVMDELAEAAAKESFYIHVLEGEERDALVEEMERRGIPFTVMTEEIGRLAREAKKKKKKRS